MKTTDKPLIKQGWLRAVIYFIGTFAVVLLAQTVATLLLPSDFGTESGDDELLDFGLTYFVMGVLIVLFTWIVRKYVDRKSFKSLGFTWKDYSNEAGLGFFAALAMLGIGTLILVLLNFLSFIGSNTNAGLLFIEIVIMIVVAFVEELLFRGYLLNNLMQSMNKWLALGVSSILFAIFHGNNPDVTIFAIVNIVLAGFFLGLNYIFTKNLWFGIFFHFAWNYFQGPVLGYEVSGLKLTSLLQQSMAGSDVWTGGRFGFEGSLLCPLLFIVAIFIFSLAFRKRYEQVLLK